MTFEQEIIGFTVAAEYLDSSWLSLGFDECQHVVEPGDVHWRQSWVVQSWNRYFCVFDVQQLRGNRLDRDLGL